MTTVPATVSRTLAARRRRSRVVTAVLMLLMALTIGVLAWVLIYVAAKGLQYIGPSFLVQNPPGIPGAGGGGFANGIIGSFIVVGIAALLAIPIGILSAVYLSEYGRGRWSKAVDFFTDILIGIPTIVTGAFVYSIWVIHFGFSGFAGSLALAIVMLPLIIRTTTQMLKLVPAEMREASDALGASKRQTVTRVVLPTALSGIITGLMLAVARAMGETAPLLLTALGNDLFTETNPGKRMSTLSLQIFSNAISGYRANQERAWAGALTLVAIVLLLTTIARFFARRSKVSR
ncbi:MAG: phosphate ABC transporter permease PstA [Candidatus Dormibacteraeota bacterium]|uniref:Phosphate transport system permease protein PstA n=1 Tax=Candidatus Aeolococcus gillhamiae TaxID=3127015 RepID=A0A934K1K6_9BACT|nr:phosphate ABC transporter permease PstA [Candidatus Dormibacteraeota bacterium]